MHCVPLLHLLPLALAASAAVERMTVECVVQRGSDVKWVEGNCCECCRAAHGFALFHDGGCHACKRFTFILPFLESVCLSHHFFFVVKRFLCSLRKCNTRKNSVTGKKYFSAAQQLRLCGKKGVVKLKKNLSVCATRHSAEMDLFDSLTRVSSSMFPYSFLIFYRSAIFFSPT